MKIQSHQSFHHHHESKKSPAVLNKLARASPGWSLLTACSQFSLLFHVSHLAVPWFQCSFSPFWALENAVLWLRGFGSEMGFSGCLFSWALCAVEPLGASLVVQDWRIHLAMQGTPAWYLVQEDPTWHRARKPMCHNYWVHFLQLLKPECLEPVLCNKRSHYNEKPTHSKKEESQLTAARESPLAATKTDRSQKIVIITK